MEKIESENKETHILKIKVVQSGEVLKYNFEEEDLNIKFKVIYLSLLKELRLKEKDAFISTDSGRMLSNIDFNLSVKEVLDKFGSSLKLYYERVL